MKMGKQVVSLELAKELKDLGVKQDSIWVWEVNSLFDTVYLKQRVFIPAVPSKYDSYFAAFTVAELGEMLPNGYNSGRSVRIERNDKDWTVWICTNFSEPQNATRAKSEADARAKMLIYLIREGIIEVGNIK